jgi:hypothetical protein
VVNEGGLRVLFAMRHLGSYRMYEPVVRELAARGHSVHIVVDRAERLGWREGLERLLDEYPAVRWSYSVKSRRTLFWFELSRLVRIWLDYLRYFDPQYDDAPILRQRAADQSPPIVVRLTDAWPLRTDLGRRLLAGFLRIAEHGLPRVPEIDEALAAEQPDIVLITPLIYLGSPQVELLRSAKALGLRSGLCVGSWDHLSSKAIIRDLPQRIFVWNHTQKAEAVNLHRVPSDHVVVTGAQCYDQWFDRGPSRSYEQFCADVGLRADRPFLMYVCSALFWGSPVEAEFVVSWIESLRRSQFEALRSIGVLVRPHPTRLREWETVDVNRFDNVRRYGSNPIDRDSRNDYFDSLYHSAAVVGLNTSAFLEAAIVGRPVHAIQPAEFKDNQEGTLHFHYLTTVGGGLLRTARDFDTHHAQLVESLTKGADNRRFVEAFIRPAGIDRKATAIFADAIEQLGREPQPVAVRDGVSVHALRVMLIPLAYLARMALRENEDAADRTTREVSRQRVRHRREGERMLKARQQEQMKRQLELQRQRQKAEQLQERQTAREVQLRERQRIVDESRREKAQRLRERERSKEKRQRQKRRAALRQRIMHKLGLA